MARRLCPTCKLGPAFRLDLVKDVRRKNRYDCTMCGSRWKLVTVFFRSRHERVR